MKKKGQKNKRKSELKVIFFIILVAAALFIISTYAWFSTQRNVSITNLGGIVEVAEGLEISLDANKWSNDIVLGTGEGELDIIDDAYPNHRNIKPKELLPVSTLGLPKDANGQARTDLDMIRGKITNSIELSEIISMNEELVIAEQGDLSINNTENPAYPGYFAFDIFLKNSSKSTTDMDELQLNYDSSVQVLESAKSSTGLQNTVRVAFALYGDNVSAVDANQTTILKETAGVGVGASLEKPKITDVAIWEPNSSDHVQYIMDNNNRIKWSTSDAALYAKTQLGENKYGFGLDTQMPTYALTDNAIGKEIADIYAWDGSEPLVKKQNVLQTTKTSDSDFEIDTDDDYSISEGVKNLVSSVDGTSSFKLPPSKVCRLRVYVWLEGQDVDCINYASFGGGVKVNIGLVKGSETETYENESKEDPAKQ